MEWFASISDDVERDEGRRPLTSHGIAPQEAAVEVRGVTGLTKGPDDARLQFDPPDHVVSAGTAVANSVTEDIQTSDLLDCVTRCQSFPQIGENDVDDRFALGVGWPVTFRK